MGWQTTVLLSMSEPGGIIQQHAHVPDGDTPVLLVVHTHHSDPGHARVRMLCFTISPVFQLNSDFNNYYIHLFHSYQLKTIQQVL